MIANEITINYTRLISLCMENNIYCLSVGLGNYRTLKHVDFYIRH